MTFISRFAFFVLGMLGMAVMAQTGPPPPPPPVVVPAQRLAHHNFFEGWTNDLAGWPGYPAMLNENLVFEQGAVYLDGLGQGGYKLQTRTLAGLNYRALGFSIRFRVESSRPVQPLLSGGVLRWMELRLEQQALVLGIDGGAQLFRFPQGVSIPAGEWISLAFSLDLDNARASVSINGGLAQTVFLPAGIVLAVERDGVNDRVFNFENRVFNTRFAGWVKHLYVYDRALADTELASESALPGTSGFTQILQPPTISGVSIAMGAVTVLPAWNLERPLSMLSRSPDICAIEGEVWARLLQPGVCQIEYRQEGHQDPLIALVTQLSFQVLGLEPPAPPESFTYSGGLLPAANISLLKSGGTSDFSLFALLDISAAAAARLARSEESYNVYVLALLPSGAFGFPVRTIMTKSSQGTWGPAAIPLDVFMRNAQLNAVNNQVVLEILLHADLTHLSGTEFYIGYGTSDMEMLAAGRYRGVYVVP